MNLSDFVAETRDLLAESQVQSMAQWLHHGNITCLAHSMYVAVTAYKIGKKLHLNTSAIARAGLLHDFYLYHKRDKTTHEGLQCFDHPVIAAENAKKITHLTAQEENIILAHMWPVGSCMPKSLEALLVNWVDTYAALLEFAGVSPAQKICDAVMGHEGRKAHIFVEDGNGLD